jgi:predicted Zn-ribbon and HTH transcriptional regulator
MVPGIAAMLIPGMQPAGGASLAGQMGRLAALGAASGAASGAGSAKEGDRMAGASTGSMIGTVTGAAAPVVLRGAGKGYNWLRDRLANTDGRATQQAARKLGSAIKESDLTPQQIERIVAQDRSIGVPSVLANASPGTVDLAEAVAQRTGRGARRIEQTLTEQKAGSRERTYMQTQKALKPGEFYDDIEKLTKDLRSSASTMYDRAYAVGEVQDPDIMRMLNIPEFKEAYKIARQIADSDASVAAARGGDPAKYALRDVYFPKEVKPGVFDLELRQYPDVRTLDYMKRALDSMVTAGYRSNDTATLARISNIKELRNALRDRVKTVVPEYDEALKKYAGDAEVIDAMKEGMDGFGKLDHEQVIKLVSGMSAAEKDAYRTGVARSLYSKIMDPSGNFNSAQRIIGSPEMQAKLQPLFENPAQFELFKNAMEREAQLFHQANKVLGGSQTAKRTQMNRALDEDSDVGVALGDVVTGTFWNSLTNLTRRVIGNQQLPEATADKLSKMLMSKEPSEVAAVVKLLEEQAAKEPRREAIKAGREAATTTGTMGAIWPSGEVQQTPQDINEGLEPKPNEVAPGLSNEESFRLHEQMMTD